MCRRKSVEAIGIKAPMSHGVMAVVCVPDTYSQVEKKPIETCKTFRGTSCRCTKDRHCLWIGIRPKGLGLRLISLQLHPVLALVGER